MALKPLNSSNLEQLAFKGLIYRPTQHIRPTTLERHFISSSRRRVVRRTGTTLGCEYQQVEPRTGCHSSVVCARSKRTSEFYDKFQRVSDVVWYSWCRTSAATEIVTKTHTQIKDKTEN